MNNVIVEKYVLGLFVNEIVSIVEKQNSYFIGNSKCKVINSLYNSKKEITVSSDLETVICKLKDIDGLIVYICIFNLVKDGYIFNKLLTEHINNRDEILHITFSTYNKHLVIVNRTFNTTSKKTNVSVTITECKYIADDSLSPYTIDVPLENMNSCLIGSTGIMLHDGSGLLLLGDPLVTGRVVTEENGFGTKGSIFIFKHNKEGKSIEYVDQLCVGKEDKFNFNPYFTIDHEISTNIKINYTPDGEGVGKSHNMKYLVDNIGSYRYINFARYLKSNYK